ncbi:helix-turn-helix domain-containing protein, partial [Phytoactinopolyspora endophytica]|uniref:AraC-like ligand-binding domain-containing protein n=1 Tax=Phytoactinopolyspora endophytica TaxID=1642495 RepID=UPI0013EC877C
MTVTNAHDIIDDGPETGHGVSSRGGAEALGRLLGDAFGLVVNDVYSDEGAVTFGGRKYRLGHILGGYLDVEPSIALSGRIMSGSYVIMAPVFSPIEVVAADQPATVQPGYALILNPDETLRLDFGRCRRFWIVCVPLSAIHTALVALSDGTRAKPPRLDRLMNVRRGGGQSWARMAMLIQQELESEGALVEVPEVARAYERALVETLLRVQRHTYSDQLQRQSAPGIRDEAGAGHEQWPRGLREVLRMIDEHPTRRHRVDDLARHANVSTKTLQKYFRQCVGVTPVEYLRVRRLDLAHQALLAADRSTTNVETIM